MIDRKKVIKGLEICSEFGSWHGLDCELNEAYKDCPYRGCETGCIVTIAKDALTLLKEQEPKQIETEEINDGRLYRCPSCHMAMMLRKQPYCHSCGQAVKWE